MWSLSYIFEIEQMWVAMILDLSSPIYLLEHNFSINYEIKSVKILNRNRMDAAPCFILAINNSPMDTKNNCEFEWFSKVFFLWKQTTKKQLRKRATQLMNECNSNKNLLLCLIIMYHNEFVIYACCLSDCVLMITKCRGKIFTTLCSPQLIFVCVCVQKYGGWPIKVFKH